MTTKTTMYCIYVGALFTLYAALKMPLKTVFTHAENSLSSEPYTVASPPLKQSVSELASSPSSDENVTAFSPPAYDARNLSSPNAKKHKLYNSGALSTSQYDRILFIVTILKAITGVITLATCMLGCVVFWCLRKESALNYFLLAINTASSLSDAVLLTKYFLTIFGGKSFEESLIGVQFSIFSLYWSIALRRFLYVTYLYICILCLLAVSFPIKPYHRKMGSYPKLTTACLFLAMLSCQTYIIPEYEPSLEDGHYIMAKSELFARDEQRFNVLGYIAKALFCYIPLLLSLILNGILLVQLKMRTKMRKSLQETFGDDCRVRKKSPVDRNFIIFMISSIFFVLMSLPSNTLQLVAAHHPTLGLYKQEYYVYSILQQTFIFCQDLSSLVGFIPYLALSTDFRRKCGDIVCFCRKQKSASYKTDTQSSQKSASLSGESRNKVFFLTVSKESSAPGRIEFPTAENCEAR